MAEIAITEKNYNEEIVASPIPVLVDYWATWCGPCQMIAPVVAEIAKEYEGRLKVAKINVDEAASLAIAAGVQSIPTLLLMSGGTVKARVIGYRTKSQLVEMLEQNGIV